MNWIFEKAKLLAEGWNIFFGLVGMVTIILTAAIKINHWMDKGENQANTIEYLKKKAEFIVTGARDETEGALKDLIDKLVAQGIIIDGTTAS